MSNASDRILSIARNRAMARSVNADLMTYRHNAEFFRRLTALDEHSLGPELATLQSIGTNAAPHPFGLRNKIISFTVAAISRMLGRLLKAASLASPYQTAYELAIQMQERQLDIETRICAELASLSSRIEELESEIHASKRTA